MKIYKILISLVIITFTFSCDNAIDIEQPGTFYLEDQYDGTVKSLADGMKGLYATLDNTNEIKFNAVFTDEISIGIENGGQQRAEYGINLTSASSSANSIWSGSYTSISRINRFLEAAENTTPDASDAAEVTEYNNLVGQAYAMRAYYHLVLQTYYTEDMTDDSKLGVIILDKVAGIDEFFPRSSNADVYDFIESDITMAEGLIQNNGVYHFGTDTLKAMRARMAAYRGDYATAEPLATQLLADYPLLNAANFGDMWGDTNDGGIIFKLRRVADGIYDEQATGMTAGGTAGSMFAFSVNGNTQKQSAYLEMSRSLFNKLDPSDARYNAYVDATTSTIDPLYQTSTNVIQTDVIAIGKYYASYREGRYLINDLKIFRSAEMLFIIAEAQAYNMDFNGVATTLKQLRDNRFTLPTNLLTITSQEEAYAAILAERRLELAFEGFRWVDLRRLGVKANVEIDRDSRDCEINGICTLDKNSHKFTMPIPLRARDVNPLLEQNFNY